MSFNELGLDKALLEGVAAMGYENPTPIQEQAIPLVLDGRDVVGCAQTGTGKTAAFVLPVLQRMSQKPGVKALVVTPTRELAGQIEEVAKICAKATSRRVLAVYGGMPYDPQAKAARKGVDLLIATPGRLLDLISHGDISLSHVEILILDEADRMLDMGFWPDVRRILRKIPDQRQNLLFSATVSRAILDVVGDTLIKPVLVEIGERATPVDEVEQKVFPVDVNQKTELLVRFLKHHKPERTLIFTRTKHRADRLQSTLIKHGIKSTAIHSNRTQQQRQAALVGF
jgi:ATP-dependent RNA helicase RhlE